MDIAVIGVGNVGRALGRGWAVHGHQVRFGAREPQGVKARAVVAESGPKAEAVGVADAMQFGEVVVLATPWAVTLELARSAELAGKVVLDCTNPLKADLSGLDVGPATSGGEQVAEAAPGARVVKIFNTTGANNMVDPRYGDRDATMFYCGDDAEAKRIAGHLAGDLGFDPVDAGPLAVARLLEPLALLWISLAYRQGLGRDFSINLDRRRS